ncbi:hypothetical protein AAC387_Pa09g1097 [Persea americana]
MVTTPRRVLDVDAKVSNLIDQTMKRWDVQMARTLVWAFKRIRIQKSSPKKEKALRWKPPPSGVFKLNMDGAMFAKIQKAGVGAIVKDEAGNVIMAMSKLESGVDSADDIEAIAALRAVQMVLHIGEIKGLLNHFIKFEVYHVGREGNAAAHVLARHPQYADDMVEWWHSTPILIKQYVSVDAILDSQ